MWVRENKNNDTYKFHNSWTKNDFENMSVTGVIKFLNNLSTINLLVHLLCPSFLKYIHFLQSLK